MAIAKNLYETFDVYRDVTTAADLQSIRRTLAKRANQRMVRLERAESKITGEKYDFGAIEIAKHYLDGKKRFSENKSYTDDISKLRREITVLQGFLTSKSSTVKGMREIENARLKTFESGNWGAKAKYGNGKSRSLKFASTKEFYAFLNSSTFKKLTSSGFTSDQIVELYDNQRERLNGEEDALYEAMEQALEDYRNGQKATLKDLTSRLKAVKISGTEE